ncbi:MAG: DUF1385 domain-containing protein [Clostridia bacterium]|nr:DUF1385 domain-containing protein [Clostridia bacterium]
MSENRNNCSLMSERLGKVGGQAVLEGVMMKSKKRYTTAVRTPDGNIVRDTHPVTSVREKVKIFNLPIIRGVVNFVEMLKLSMSTLTFSAEAAGVEEQEETKFEKWLAKTFGASLVGVIAAVGMVLGVALSVCLFMWFPAVISGFVGGFFENILSDTALNAVRSVLEGLLKITLFVLYVWGVSFMPDIKKTFQYHGAEHKSIFCYEAGLDLTVENVRRQKRLHPRCGTSFMIVMMIIGIVISMFITWDNMFLRVILKLITLPLVVGLGYEFLMYAGRHDNALIRMLSAPGLWLQNITTCEPDDSQIEVAIVALKSALPEVFPEESVFENIKLPGVSETADTEDIDQ